MATADDILARRIAATLASLNRELDRLTQGIQAMSAAVAAATQGIATAVGGVESLRNGLGAVSGQSARAGFDASGARGGEREDAADPSSKIEQHLRGLSDAVRGHADRLENEAVASAERAAAASVDVAFDVLEDALADFVKSGKLSFSDLGNALRDALVQALLSDAAVPAFKRSVLAPIAGAFSSSLDDVLDSVFGASATSPAPSLARSIAVVHGGGVAGASGGVRRAVPPALFAGAPRVHAGSIAGLRGDEVPAILQRGETVLPRGAQAAAPSFTVNFENRGTPQREVSSRVGFDGRRWVLDVVVDDIAGGGPLATAIERATGARAAAQ